MLELHGQVVELYNIVIDFIGFLFKFVKFACGVFFDCHVNEAIDKGLLEIVP